MGIFQRLKKEVVNGVVCIVEEEDEEELFSKLFLVYMRLGHVMYSYYGLFGYFE